MYGIHFNTHEKPDAQYLHEILNGYVMTKVLQIYPDKWGPHWSRHQVGQYTILSRPVRTTSDLVPGEPEEQPFFWIAHPDEGNMTQLLMLAKILAPACSTWYDLMENTATVLSS